MSWDKIKSSIIITDFVTQFDKNRLLQITEQGTASLKKYPVKSLYMDFVQYISQNFVIPQSILFPFFKKRNLKINCTTLFLGLLRIWNFWHGPKTLLSYGPNNIVNQCGNCRLKYLKRPSRKLKYAKLLVEDDLSNKIWWMWRI